MLIRCLYQQLSSLLRTNLNVHQILGVGTIGLGQKLHRHCTLPDLIAIALDHQRSTQSKRLILQIRNSQGEYKIF